jgi:hypothetical protein
MSDLLSMRQCMAFLLYEKAIYKLFYGNLPRDSECKGGQAVTRRRRLRQNENKTNDA